MNQPTTDHVDRAIAAVLEWREERKQNMNNIGHLNGNWKSGNRPTLDDAPLSPLDELQCQLNAALSFIFTGNLPIIVSRGLQMEAEVKAEVLRMVENGATK